jgi:RNA polymerase nonessential primary-like sigma factor
MINYTNLNQNINIYFKEIRSFKSLSKRDEEILFSRIELGDKKAETEVFNRLAKLAVAVAKTYTCRPELLSDLIQEANLGVLTAIHKFDINKGYRFSSYARWWMKARIYKYLNEMSVVRPGTNSRILWLAKKIAEQFYMENCREISDIELLDELESRGEVVTDLNAILSIKAVRIDVPINEQSDTAQVDLGIFSTRTASRNEFEEDEENESLSSDIARRMSRLDSREQEIVRLKFGFITGYEIETNKDLTKEWNDRHPEQKTPLTEERVRQILVGALKKMK